jgi:hypothetical protein
MKERLIEFLSYLKIGQTKFEEKVGLSRGFVNNIGENITSAPLKKIMEKHPELNINWLKTGEGKMIKPISQQNKVNANNGIVGIQGDGNNITNNDISAIKELMMPIYSLMEDKDEQIDKLNEHVAGIINILKSKDEQINKLIGIIEKHGTKE